MVKTYIPITGVRTDNFLPYAKSAQFGTVLLLAIASGFFIGINSPNAFPTTTRSLIGAVSESSVNTDSTNSQSADTAELALSESTDEPPLDNALIETFTAPQFFATPAATRSKEELQQLIAESEVIINEETNEVARIRNASVAIVSEFETNCGDWEDDCAAYYARVLERNNIAYNTLVQKIDHEMRVLEELKNESAMAQ